MTDSRPLLDRVGGQIARVIVVVGALIVLGLTLAGLAAVGLLIRWLLGL